MRIVITGASGFIGGYTLRAALAAGHEIHALGRTAPAHPGVAFHACDLIDGTGLRALMAAIRPEALLHLAWYAEPGKFWTAPENLDWVAASLRLTRAFAESGGTRLVVAGTCAEYDWSHALLDEATTPLRPATLYGKAKAGLFDLLHAAAPALGLSLGWGRIFVPYGPGDRPERLIGALIAALREHRPADFSAGTQERDFIHAADVGAALVALLASTATGPVNIGSGEAIAVRRFVELAAGLVPIAADLRFSDRPLPATEPPLLVASTGRLHNEIGFTPRFDHHTGLSDTLAAAGLSASPLNTRI